jgi:hypothetical protein
MVRGTYFPCPAAPERVRCAPEKLCRVQLTGLREEGAKALIRFGSFAFFGQVSIRLFRKNASEKVAQYAERVRRHWDRR